MTSSDEQQHGRHPTFKQYVVVATILFLVTIFEFLMIYDPLFSVTRLDALGPAKVPLLFILSAFKFGVVIMFYMHLKFDSKLFSLVFMAGLILAFSVAIAVMSLFTALGGNPRAYAEEHRVYYDEHAAREAREAKKTAPTPTVPVPTVLPATTQPPSPDAVDATAVPEAPSEPPAQDGNPALVAQGQEIFTGKAGCSACHTIEGIATGPVGPDLTHIATDGASRNPPQTAREYITQSIREPEAFVATGLERAIPGIMTSGITAGLSDDEVDALTEFLLAQK